MYGKKGNTATTTQAKDLGFGYRKSYKDKKTGADVSYLKIALRPEQLADVQASANGLIELVVFSNSGPKKSEKSPDVTVKPAAAKKGDSNASSIGRTGTTNSNFPF
jgi:UDP-N-acetylenolpyruvoylglucosamine reductase